MKWTTLIIGLLVVVGCSTSVLLPNLNSVPQIPEPTSAAAVEPSTTVSRTPSSIPNPIKPIQPPPIANNTNKNNARTDTVIDQLYTASMAFSAPEKANIKENITIQLFIDPSKEVKELENSLTQPGVRRGAEIKISKVIIASLSAPDFIIEKVTPEEQAVAQTAPTEWLWTLTPKSTGKNEVKLTITAIVKVDGKEYKYHIKTYEKTMVIVVEPQQVIYDWLAKYWQWLFSTLLLPLGLWLYKRNKKVELPTP